MFPDRLLSSLGTRAHHKGCFDLGAGDPSNRQLNEYNKIKALYDVVGGGRSHRANRFHR